MTNLVFLLVAVVISVVGVTVLVLRSRPPSSSASPHSSVEQFNEKMRALAPEPGTEADDRSEGRVVRRGRSRRS